MALLLKPDLERLLPRLPTTEPVADDKLYMRGPFLALSGIDVTWESIVVENELSSVVPNQDVFKAEMPTGTGFAKTSPFVIRSTVAYFSGDGGVTPNQPFVIGRIPDNPSDTTYSAGYWVHEIDYNPGGTYTAHERYDVLRPSGPGHSTHWGSGGDIPGSRRAGYTYEAFSNNLGDNTKGTIYLQLIGESVKFVSSYINPMNPSIGIVGDYFSCIPNQATGAVNLQLGTSASENFVATCTASLSSLTASGDMLLDGRGVVSLVENDQALAIRMNDSGSKQISVYADGVGKSIRLGNSAIGLIVNQTRVEVENGNVLIGEGYDLTASHLRVRIGGLIDLFAGDPGKMGFATGDGYTVLCAARDSSDASYTMLGVTGFYKSFNLKPDMRIGWHSTVTELATSAFRLNSGAIEAVNASDALIDFKCNNITFGTHTSSSDAAVSGYVTITDAGGTSRKLAVIT